MVVFNLEVTRARFALKTTTAFNEEYKKENSAKIRLQEVVRKKWSQVYLAKATAQKASISLKLSKYNRGHDFGEQKYYDFFRQFEYLKKLRTCRNRPADTQRDHPGVGGGGKCAPRPRLPLLVCFEKYFFQKKFVGCAPPWTPSGHLPPMDLPFFLIFFSILDHRSPFLYFFLLLYYCYIYIFTVFIHFLQ